MAQIYNNLTDLIGRTPILRLRKMMDRTGSEIVGMWIRSFNLV